MRRLWPLFIFVTIFVFAILMNETTTKIQAENSNIPNRVISLAPSVTEIVFALGGEDKLIAVTDFCDYPPKAETLTKVGGYLDPSLEKITSLKPDLVILLANQQQTIKQLSQLHIPVLAVRNSTLDEIKASIDSIAESLALKQQGHKLLTKIESHSRSITEKVSGLKKPTVVISIGHSGTTADFKQFFIAGQQDFYNDLLQVAGGVNAYSLPQPAVPALSLEGLLALDPDIIIDIFPEPDDHNDAIDHIRQQWQTLSQLSAVQNNQVHIIEEDYATVPGPRIYLMLQRFAQIIHPEIKWQNHAQN